MSKRKSCHSAVAVESEEHVERTRSSVVVNRLAMRRAAADEFLLVLERVQRITAEVMTLAVKLGTLVILESQEPSPLFSEEVFWSWCIEAVTWKQGKHTLFDEVPDQPERGLTYRATKLPKRKAKESEQHFVNRTDLEIAKQGWKEEQRHEKHRLHREWIVSDKDSIKMCIGRVWNRVDWTGAPIHGRDNLTALNTTQVAAYLVNLKLYVATTISKRVAKVVGIQLERVVAELIKPTKRAKSMLHGALLNYTMKAIQGQPKPAWKAERTKLVTTLTTPSMWTAVGAIVVWHRCQIPADTDFNDSKALQANAWRFLLYFRELCKLHPKPFAIVPQIKPSARHVRLGCKTFPAML